MEKIEIVSHVFEAIKQNWSKNGSFQSLAEIICQRLGVPITEEICENLKKSEALWLNNHLEEPLEEETEEEKAEINDVKPSEEIKKSPHFNSQKKNHDYH
jgi:flagellar biosynthesis component FlhA